MPRDRPRLTKDQVTEILVFRHQQAIFAICAAHDLYVGRPRRNIGHVDSVVPALVQKGDQRRIHAFVDQPAHAVLAIDERFIGQIVGGEGLRRPNVFERQSRVVADDRFSRHAGAELAQHDFDRHARAPDHGSDPPMISGFISIRSCVIRGSIACPDSFPPCPVIDSTFPGRRHPIGRGRRGRSRSTSTRLGRGRTARHGAHQRTESWIRLYNHSATADAIVLIFIVRGAPVKSKT